MSWRFSWARVTVAVAGLAGAWMAASWLVAGVALAAFLVLVRHHQRVEDALARFRTWRRIKDEHRARMTLDWDALPAPLDAPTDPDHPFVDLHLDGPRSLHHLLDASSSAGGSRRLLKRLRSNQPGRERIREHQEQTRQLMRRSLYRDRLLMLGRRFGQSTEPSSERRQRWSGDVLYDWLERSDAAAQLRPWLWGLGALAALNAVLALGHFAGFLPPIWPFTLLAYLGVYWQKHRAYGQLFDEAHELDLAFQHIAAPLRHLEEHPFPDGTPLTDLLAPMQTQAPSPSEALRRLKRITSAASLTRSEFLQLLLNVLGPWDLFFAHRLHRLKEALGDRLPAWLDCWHEMESACSLAAYAEHHPERAFADVAGDGSLFEGEALGHPLLPEDEKVRNDFAFERSGELALVTGSNMSGKSTFLRTVGMNARLAQAGAPADARALRMRPLRLFTCMNVADSVQEGLSYFYAEVRRLRRLYEVLHEDGPPLFFLIDEIFRGTNNRERLAGSRTFVRAVAGGSGVGLISTHDLELTALEDEIPLLQNYHFEEEVENGRMVFDYRLKRGPCTSTNALRIMEREGLPVEPATADG
ncbi:MAG: hypothetical protein BRD45_05520 [Bacteroidetes bacterium QS_8_64_10]|nr:MAG: hypothetical protein BRD45_05520 [Bacteroidetes bacterium QS_8_64_10]